MEQNKLSRRNFCKTTLAVLSITPALSLLNSASAFAADEEKPLDPNSPIPQQLGYNHDAMKVDPVKFPRRKEPGAEKQECGNCILSQGATKKLASAEGDWLKCTLFTDGLVNVKGWCNSYAPRPA